MIVEQGFGFSTVLTTTLLALFASVPREQIPVATGGQSVFFSVHTHSNANRLRFLSTVSYLFRTTGQVLGVSLSSTLTQSLLAKNLRERITVPNADEVRHILPSTPSPSTFQSPQLQND